MTALRTTEQIYNRLPFSGVSRFLVVQPSTSLRDPLHCSLQVLPITKPSYNYLFSPIQTRKKTAPIFLNGQDARMQFEIELCLRYMRHETKEQMFWIRSICANGRDSAETSIHDRQNFDLVNGANRVMAFMGKPPRRWDLELIAKTLQQIHDMVGNNSAPPQNKTAFKEHYEPVLQLFAQAEHSPQTKDALNHCIELLSNPVWRERWTLLQTAGVFRNVDLYVGKTLFSLDAFYTLANFVSDAKSLGELNHLKHTCRPNNIEAACRIARYRKGMLQLLERWKPQLTPNGALPADLVRKVQEDFYLRENAPAWKKIIAQQEDAVMEKIKKQMNYNRWGKP
ncbi:hypothetical protein QBC41DRAFT_236445 [Cercophora samala]|uniref:Uncharacterized protein n=1 Tax=Cercophora samala TaxID=330535 RepID=A0AA40D3T5_9PEZI|nr:hypothetical protein QBC41DRAFT_236445 [Cercophora samala]